MGVFLSHRRDRWLDGWTYGAWSQWVCRHPGSKTQCARVIFPLPFGWAVMFAVGPMNNGNRRILPGEDA